MSLNISQESQSIDCTFTDYWKKSNGEIIYNQVHEFENERNSDSQSSKMRLRTIQLRTIQQEDGDQSCGYYSIFFISKLSQIFTLLSTTKSMDSKTTDSILKLMKDIRSREAFDSFKQAIIKELLAECRRQNGDKYPWIEDHINSGVLERVYLQYLQNNWFRKHRLSMPHNDNDNDEGYEARYDQAIANKYKFRYLYDVINLMEFSESSLKTNHLPLITMDHLEYFFNQRFVTNIEQFKGFVIGSAIHYVVCAVYRNQNGDIDLIYLDPQNNNILYKTKSELQNKVIANMKFASWLKYGWKLDDMQKLAMDSFRGIQFAITDLLTNTIFNLYAKNYNPYFIRDKLVTMNISDGFLAGFKSHVLLPMVRTISKEQSSDNDQDEEKGSDEDKAPKTGLFVGVHKDFEYKNNDNEEDVVHDTNIDINKWKHDCDFVINVITEKLKNIKLAENSTDLNVKKEIQDIRTCSDFAKLWISTYYPSAVIDQNIVNVVNKLENESYIPKSILKSLYAWASLMMVFANAQNRQLAEIKDDQFWKRLASTLLVVQMVAQTDAALTKL